MPVIEDCTKYINDVRKKKKLLRDMLKLIYDGTERPEDIVETIQTMIEAELKEV